MAIIRPPPPGLPLNEVREPAPAAIDVPYAGKTYPVKWQLRYANGGSVNSLLAVSSISVKSTSCTAFSTDPTGALPAPATGGTALRYDSGANQYVHNWQTSAKGCFTLFLTLSDGHSYPAFFKLT